MTIRDWKTLKQTASRRLEAASYQPRRLILIHSGVTLGAALLMAILQYIIIWQIDVNGGDLSGIELRSALETAQIVLTIAYGVLMPFWTMGIIYSGLRLARRKAAFPQALLEGFHRRGPVLRLLLMEGLIYGILTMIAIYGAWFFYTMTSDGQAFMEAITRLIVQQGIMDYAALYAEIPEPVLEQVASVYVPIFCAVLAVLVIPAFYRMRMAPYVLMDKDGTGAWKAIRTSGKITRRNGWRLVALDLSYWWYYLVCAVLAVFCFADVLLPLLKIQLPVDAAVIYVAGNVLYAVLTLIFAAFTKPKLQTVYALAYDTLLQQYQAVHPLKPEESGRVVDSSGYAVRNEE